MPTSSSRNPILLTAKCLALTVASAICLSLAGMAQNSAVSFTTSRQIPTTLRPFSYYTPYAYGAVCNILFAGHFHSGRRTDLAGTCANSFSSIEFSTVLLNQGNGTFRAIETPDADTGSAFVVAATDLDVDGFTDLI